MKFKIGDIIQHKKFKSLWRIKAVDVVTGWYKLEMEGSTDSLSDIDFNKSFVERRFNLKREILFEETMS